MPRYQDQITDEHLHPVANAEIWVFHVSGPTPDQQAPIFDDLGQPLTQPILSNADGIFAYNAADGLYENQVHYGGQLRFVQQCLVGIAVGVVLDGDRGDITVSNAAVDWNIDPNTVGNLELRDSAALSIIGRAANSTGDPADIAAGADGHVLRRSGVSLGFGQLTALSLADGSVGTNQLANGAVTNAKLAPNSVDGSNIIDNSITSFDLAGGAVGTDQLANGAVTSAKIGAKAVGTAHLATDAVNSDILAPNAVTETELANGAVTSGKIAPAAVGTLQLADASVTAPKLAADAVPMFDADSAGLVPASGGSINEFLRADGQWAAIPATQVDWGEISGNLSAQVDLQGELDSRVSFIDNAHGWGTGSIGLEYAAVLVGRAGRGFAAVFDGTTTGPGGLYLADPPETTWWQIAKAGPDPHFKVSGNTKTQFVNGILLPDDSYGAGWDGNLEAPTKNAIFDGLASKAIFSTSAAGLAPLSPGGTTAFLRADGVWSTPPGGGGGGATDDTPYGPGWNGVTTISPSQNATYDKLAAMDISIAGKADLAGATFTGPVNVNYAWGLTVDGGAFGYVNAKGTSGGSFSILGAGGEVAALTGTAAGAMTLDFEGTLSLRDYSSLAVGATFTPAGAATFNGGGEVLTLKPGTADNVFIGFYPDTQAPSTRGAYIGYGSPGSALFNINNAMAGGAIEITAANDIRLIQGGTQRFNTTADGAVVTGNLYLTDEAYGAAWDGKMQAPTKNAVYDKINALEGSLDGYATDAELSAGLAGKANLAGGNTFSGQQLLGFQPVVNASLYVRGAAAGGEGGQLTLGWAGTEATITAGNSSWNIDSDLNNDFRVFSLDAGGVPRIPITIDGPTGETYFGYNVQVPNEAYGAGWNGNAQVPTKDAVYDKIEAVVASIPASPVSDTAYGAGWNGVANLAPSQNAVYDQMELRAPLASPALTGTPTAPTQAVGNSTTRIATTAFVQAEKATVKVTSTTSNATLTPAFGDDITLRTTQTVGLTIANWSGTAIDCWGMVIRIKSVAAQTIAYGTNYRAIGVTLPTTTVAGKTLYLGVIHNATDGKHDVVSVAQEA